MTYYRALALGALALVVSGFFACSSAPLPVKTRSGSSPLCSDIQPINNVTTLANLASCTTIVGDLTIRGAALEDLQPIASIERITGSLHIGPTLGLTAIDGLNGLKHLGGDLVIDTNMEVTVAFFPHLRAVDGNLLIRGNNVLTNVDAPVLERVLGAIDIQRNPNLARIALSALERVQADFVVYDNAALSMLEAPNIQRIGGNAKIQSNVEPPPFLQVTPGNNTAL